MGKKAKKVRVHATAEAEGGQGKRRGNGHRRKKEKGTHDADAKRRKKRVNGRKEKLKNRASAGPRAGEARKNHPPAGANPERTLTPGQNEFVGRPTNGVNPRGLKYFTQAERFVGHRQAVYAVDWAPCGSTLVSCSGDRFVFLWDPNKPQKPLRKLKGHSSHVLDVRFSPDGKFIASASRDGTVRLWRHHKPKALYAMDGHDGNPVHSCRFSPCGLYIASSDKRGRIAVWSVKAADLRSRMNPDRVACESNALLCISEAHPELEGGHAGPANKVAWVNGSACVVSASDDNMLKLWRFESVSQTLVLESTFEGHKDYVLNVASSPNGRIVSCCHDGTCRVWDVATAKVVRRLVAHTKVVYGARLSPVAGMRRTITVGHDNRICLWDAARGELIHQMEGCHQGWILDAAWSPNGTCFVTASSDNTMLLFKGCPPPENFAYYVAFRTYVVIEAILTDVTNLATKVYDRLRGY